MSTSHDLIRSIVTRIERVDEDIKTLNDDKRDIYAEAKSQGFDVKALKAVVALRRKDAAELQEHNAIVETYLAALGSGTTIATRAPAREATPVVTTPKPVPAPARTTEPVEVPDIPAFLERKRTTALAQ